MNESVFDNYDRLEVDVFNTVGNFEYKIPFTYNLYYLFFNVTPPPHCTFLPKIKALNLQRVFGTKQCVFCFYYLK